MSKHNLIIIFIIFIFSPIKIFSQEDNDSTFIESNQIETDTIKSDTIKSENIKSERKKRKKNKESERIIPKPEAISRATWKQKSIEQKDSLLLAWSDYDVKYYKKKYATSDFQKKRIRKTKKNFFDKIIIARAKKKPIKYRRKLIKRKNERFKKTLDYDRPVKMNDEEWAATSPEDRMLYIVKKNRYQGQQEAIRKNRIVQKYDKKEDKINKKYSLTLEEKMILNKGSSMHLRGPEQMIYKRARTKQEKYTSELLVLRRRRQIEIQNPATQKRMKQNRQKTEDKYGKINKEIKKKEKQAIKKEKKRAKQRNKKRK